MKFRVEIQESATETARGFLSVEDDENPNRNVKIAEFASHDEAAAAIKAEIDRDRIAAREFAYLVLDEAGVIQWTTYYDEVYKHWDTFD
jgi:hypothetical protein